MRLVCLRAVALIVITLFSLGAQADPFHISASQVLLVDGDTGTVLFAKNADKSFIPASLSKIMTAEVIFEALENGDLQEDSEYQVSEYAWRTGGAPSRSTTMFASLNSHISVSNLLQGLIVPQGNDAAIILAEGFCGSESAFAEKMNERAKALGMEHTHFVNPTGLPADGQETTLRDMITLARHIVDKHPERFKLYSQPSFEWNRIFQRNRNPLLLMEIHGDGFATGFVEKEGHSIIATAEKNGRRLFLALNGLPKEKDRNEEARRFLEWGMTAFETKLIYDAEEVIGAAKVFGGTQSTVPIKTVSAIGVLLPKQNMPKIKARIIYQGPLQAPVEAGKVIGNLVLLTQNDVLVEQPIMTANDVEEAGLGKKAGDALFEITFGWLRKYL